MATPQSLDLGRRREEGKYPRDKERPIAAQNRGKEVRLPERVKKGLLECAGSLTNGGISQMKLVRTSFVAALAGILLVAGVAQGQQKVLRDPAEPPTGAPHSKAPARMTKAVARQSVDTKSMLALINKLVACGTRLTLSSWTDPKRGAGCGRDQIAARLEEISKETGGKLQVIVDKFEATAERTSGKSIPLENVYAILPGADETLKKTVFLVSGHFDSRPSDVMDAQTDAPGADDDASGVAVSVETARLLSKLA